MAAEQANDEPRVMKSVRSISSAVLSLTISVTAFAQDIRSMLDDVRRQAAEALVTVTYTAEVEGPEGVFRDEGMIEAQDGLWHLSGSMVEIFTDAEGTWIVDASAKEVYIEPKWTYDDLLTFYESFVSAGSSLKFDVVSSTCSPKKSESLFTPRFTPEWVVTDLR